MDWKTYYRNEMIQPSTKAYLAGLFESFNQDQEMDALVRRGAVLSFPHTAAHYTGPLQGRVVSTLYRFGVKRVIALGVVHTSTLPSPYDEMYRPGLDDKRPPRERGRAYASLRRGFIPDRHAIDTAFGKIPSEWIVTIDYATKCLSQRREVAKEKQDTERKNKRNRGILRSCSWRCSR